MFSLMLWLLPISRALTCLQLSGMCAKVGFGVCLHVQKYVQQAYLCIPIYSNSTYFGKVIFIPVCKVLKFSCFCFVAMHLESCLSHVGVFTPASSPCPTVLTVRINSGTCLSIAPFQDLLLVLYWHPQSMQKQPLQYSFKIGLQLFHY